MNSLKEIYKHILAFFIYSYSEKKGILTFIGLYLIYLGLSHLNSESESERIIYDHSEFNDEVEAFMLSQNNKEKKSLKRFQSKETKFVEQTLFYFDPNTTSMDSLILLGFSEYSAGNIEKYRLKGGEFMTAKDIQKIYGVDEDLFNRINAFVRIDKKEDSIGQINQTYQTSENRSISVTVNLNSATKEELMSVRGIGPVFAKRIITYRNRLGGYLNKDQLKEVYGITDSNFVQIALGVEVSEIGLKKLNVNLLNAKDLIAHPYFENWNVVNAIVKYREQHGLFNEVSDLKKIHIIDTLLYKRISPYLTTN